MKICTHDGIFHADEVMATAILKRCFDLTIFEITRSRNPIIWAEHDICVDVGGSKYDHHQRGFNTCRENGVMYATAGLVWKDYSDFFIGSVLYNGVIDHLEKETLDEELSFISNRIDKQLMEPIDLHDNGQTPIDKKYMSYGLSAIVSGFNYFGNMPGDNIGFYKAVDLCLDILSNTVLKHHKDFHAKTTVEKAMSESNERNDGLLILDKFVPWQQYVNSGSGIIYTLFYDEKSSDWKVVCNREVNAENNFTEILKFPMAWRGLNGKEMTDITGVKESVFCHNGGFIAGALNKEAAIKLAKLSISSQQ